MAGEHSNVNIAPDQMPRLRKLWNVGLSALECGQELGLAGDDQEIREAVLRAIEGGPKAYPSREARIAKARADTQARASKRATATPQSNLPRRFRTKADDGADQPFGESDGIDGTPAPEDLEIPLAQRKTLFQLTAKNCHWPVGEPKEPGFFFCGGDAVPDEVYCPHHCKRAYNGRLHRRKIAA